MANQPVVDNGFDSIAPFYDALSRLVFGNALRKAQACWLNQIPPGAEILVFGGGSGWLLARLLAVCHPRHVSYIDASAAMITLARQKVDNDSRVDFRTGTELSIQPGDKVDVVITPFVLDLFAEERLKIVVLPRLFSSLKPGGLWLCCDFLEPRWWWQKILLWSEYRFFRAISRIEADHLPNWQHLLETHLPLNPGQMTTFFGGMIGSGYWRK
ncbi:class I SAM-dependent methyltransferase [Larkinella insperata]|uniref:Class I SAM-dependent methyltransferase n=1 Tax=Larkinella insperata TaxID=332158 RepID=A0ABW3Q2P4_9BACT|nr:methyltransferase domain-containing protein [Larkinella insperata]